MPNGRDAFIATIDGKLAGQEVVSERELLIGIYYAVRIPRPLLDWKPKEMAAAVVAVLSAIGLTSIGTATAVIALLGG